MLDALVPEALVPEALVPHGLFPEAMIPEAMVPEAMVLQASGRYGFTPTRWCCLPIRSFLAATAKRGPAPE